MKKIGLIGGFSWVSTIDYYRYINQGVNEKLGGLNYAECMICSLNYEEIKNNNDAGRIDKTEALITEAGLHLKQSGAEALVICANTMHIIADNVQKSVGLPVIHIAIATAAEIAKQGLKKVGLLGTKFTMEHDFFKLKLKEKTLKRSFRKRTTAHLYIIPFLKSWAGELLLLRAKRVTWPSFRNWLRKERKELF